MNINLHFPEHEHLNCPRCDSNNTKFCYYNNYNLSQPRHYCKNCRRYWTKGGTLRKIPIGGTTRKTTKRSSSSNKRPHDSSSTATASPPAQLMPESSVVSGFNDARSGISGGSSNSPLRLNDLTPNLSGGSENDDLNKNAETEVFRLSDRNRSGESSGCDGGGNRWPDLSISTSGSESR